MAQFGVQTSEFKVLTPKPNYEFLITGIEEVPNDRGQFAYDPETDDPKKSTKLEWAFAGRDGTDAAGVIIKKRTPSYLTSDKRNGWLKFSTAADPTFDGRVGYKDMDDLRKRSIGRPVMLAISNTTKTVNGEERTYNNIDNAYPSSLPAMSAEEIVVAALGLTPSEEIPF